MSRSYKKSPVSKDPANKYIKRYANKKARNAKDKLPKKGKSYRKYYESYDISDWWFRQTRQEAINEYESAEEDSWIRNRFKTLKDYLKYWEKCYKRK